MNQASVLVSDNEPETHLWYALRVPKNTFMIFDTFSDKFGRATHFAGKAASTLKDHSERLIVAGWEGGVVANIENYDIISVFSR